MKKQFYSAVLSLFVALISSTVVHAKPAKLNESSGIERGRYLVRITGCNDCHTPMYGPLNGEVPEKDWLIGVPVGWKGGWGTTYATNLRQRAANMTEDQWVSYLKNLKSRPPMPYFAVNEFSEKDSRAIYKFIKSLGDHSQVIPAALPPGEKPATPYVNFEVLQP